MPKRITTAPYRPPRSLSSIAWLVTAPAITPRRMPGEELEHFEQSFNNAIQNTRYLLERYAGKSKRNNANVPEGKD